MSDAAAPRTDSKSTASTPGGSGGASAGSPDPERQRVKLSTAFNSWRGRLIDLTMRNRALNYRPLKVGTLRIDDERPAEVFRLLVVEEQELTFSPTLSAPSGATTGAQDPDPNLFGLLEPAGDGPGDPEEGAMASQPFAPYTRSELADRHTDSVLQCLVTPERLDNSLRRLAELQRTSLEEQGVNTLYLALGFLHYKEAPQADSYLRAPLILVPVILERQNARTGYKLSAGDDEPVFNPSLVEYLKRVHGITDLPSLPDLSDEASPDLLPFYTAIQGIAEPRGWKVTEDIVLATFAFQKLVMFKDLEANEQQYASHAQVRRVVLKEGDLAHDLPPDIQGLELDRDYPPESTFQVMDADSSQLKAIAAVSRKHDLVIHGPPGTGKSQTITNLIADALGNGQRVLFVSEKMAALEVVHRRLSEAKLGEFCLELHSTKGAKREVLDELRRTLQAHGDPAPGAASSRAALASTRTQLNNYARALHQRRTTLDCSAFRAIGEFASAYSAPRFPFPGDPTAMPNEAVNDILERIRRAMTLGAEVEPVAENGWRGARLEQYSESVGDRIAAVLESARALAATFRSEAAELSTAFGVPNAPSLDRGLALSRVAEHIASATGMPAGVLRDASWATRPGDVAELLDLGRKYAALEARLAARYRRDALEEVDQEDVRYVEAKHSGFLSFLAFLDGRYRAIRRRWREMRVGTAQLSMIDQAADLKLIPRWQRDRKGLKEHASAPSWFGTAWKGPASDWRDLDQRVAWVEQFHQMARQQGPFTDEAYAIAEKGGKQSPLPGQVRGTVEKLRVSLQELCDLLQWPSTTIGSADAAQTASRLEELHRDLRRGPAWVSFFRAIKALSDTPAREPAAEVLEGRLPSAQLERVFKRALYGAWLEKTIQGIPELDEFRTATHEDGRLRFQQHDRSLLTENQSALVGKLRAAGSSRYAGSQAAHRAFLQREFAKQTRFKPLRVTLREAGEAIAALKPCFLMSPMSVSQFLSPTQGFDLVIFDEASQLPTEDAIGAICRGKQLVVVGDPKQLPPTNFFAVQVGAAVDVDEDGNPIVEETESVLEEFQAAGLPQAYLEWHYRSAHEALIQFSNERFYGNRLVVFPAAATDGPEFGLKFERIDGRYEGAGLNSVEARAVAAAVVEHFRTRPHESLGVGTFNQRQQMAIMDELERYRREDPALEEHFDRAAREPFFVKNLENIQGDERDVIFLSITYARQADGVLRYNFGPLNRQEGWRRLNVLVSRARKRMRVFSSLTASDINPTATASQGPALLRDFLQFAETGRMQSAAVGTAADAESPFELEVAGALRGFGYLVDMQVGVGSYRIDLGVRHRDRPGRYLAGVECDGAAYHASPCARDRDRLRQYVLERRGWTILRVWSTDWFKDRAGTLERLKLALEAQFAHLGEQEALQNNPPPEDTRSEVETPTPPSAARATAPARPYTRPRPAPYPMASHVLPTTGNLADASPSVVARHVKDLVEKEGPLHQEHLVSRLLSVWGHERRGNRLVSAATEGINRAVLERQVVRRGEFLYASEGKAIEPRDRSGLDIAAEHICPEELEAAIQMILKAADCMDEAELEREVRAILGLRRTHDGAGAIQALIKTMVERGVMVYGVTGLRLKAPS